MKHAPSSKQTNEKHLEKRLENIELILKEVQENLKKLNKETDMTQKIIHVEVATNALRVEQELRKKLQELHKENLTKLDSIVGELQTLREENTIGTYHSRELREEIEKLQKRILIIEKAQSAT